MKEIKKNLNTDFSFTILNLHMKLEEYLNNVLLEGSVSHFFSFRSLFNFYDIKRK